uniref:Uncharacterized protein n=1 Tax=Arundo donax TaxID=35708 RepID=A0A0A9HNM4_ARUDO
MLVPLIMLSLITKIINMPNEAMFLTPASAVDGWGPPPLLRVYAAWSRATVAVLWGWLDLGPTFSD